MIFVTVGTHEQPFNRLVKHMDDFAASGKINEEIIIQSGYSTYEPQYCKWKKLFSYQEMLENVAKARIVITHGGPSSFIMPLQMGKTPIVVPRKKEYDEHINNHQVDFCRAVAERMGTIILFEDVSKLGDAISNYDALVYGTHKEIKSNNDKFCSEFSEIINSMYKGK